MHWHGSLRVNAKCRGAPLPPYISYTAPLHLALICINGNYNALYACQRAIANGIPTSKAFYSSYSRLYYTCSLILIWYTKYMFPGLRGAINTWSLHSPESVTRPH